MIRKLLIIFMIIGMAASCNKKNKKNPELEPEQTYDKQVLLSNLADNVILPSYNAFKASLDSLSLAYSNFKTTGSQTDFQTLKQKLHVAYLNYQYISPFEFGPAENTLVRMNFNVFPTDTVQIRSNVATLVYDLNAANNLDAKGFPALDFLVYGNNQTESSIINQFTINSGLKQYVSDLINDMSTKLNSVISAWTSAYRNTFVSSLSTDVGSSIGFLVNQLNYELDYVKNAKIGTPLGKKSLGVPFPEKTEAYYGQQSLQYLMRSLIAVENVYLGRGLNGMDGEGFDNYLAHLDAQYNGGSLNDAINNQFAMCKAKINAIADPLSAQVTANPAIVDAAYNELVKLLVLLKTDMPSNLGVIITYQDGDGD